MAASLDTALAGLLGMRVFFVFLTLSSHHITLTLSSGVAAYRRACPEPVRGPRACPKSCSARDNHRGRLHEGKPH